MGGGAEAAGAAGAGPAVRQPVGRRREGGFGEARSAFRGGGGRQGPDPVAGAAGDGEGERRGGDDLRGGCCGRRKKGILARRDALAARTRRGVAPP